MRRFLDFLGRLWDALFGRRGELTIRCHIPASTALAAGDTRSGDVDYSPTRRELRMLSPELVQILIERQYCEVAGPRLPLHEVGRGFGPVRAALLHELQQGPPLPEAARTLVEALERMAPESRVTRLSPFGTRHQPHVFFSRLGNYLTHPRVKAMHKEAERQADALTAAAEVELQEKLAKGEDPVAGLFQGKSDAEVVAAFKADAKAKGIWVGGDDEPEKPATKRHAAKEKPKATKRAAPKTVKAKRKGRN